MRCVFCRAYRSKPGHRLLSAGCTLLSTVRAQSALRAGAVAHGHYYSTRRARVCQGGFTNFSQKNGGKGGSAFPFFSAPIPLPPSRREGGESKFSYARGFAPCIPGIKPLAALTEPAKQVPGGGLPCLSPANPAFGLLSCPHPPAPPFPAGRGRPRLFHARGFAPGAPAFNRLRHLQSLPSRYPAGACPVGRLPTLPLVCFFAPYPPNPLPRRGRGRFLVYFAGGFAPGTPAPEPKRAPEQGSEPRARRGLVPGGVGRGEKPGNEHKCRFRETIKNREKFWGVRGTLSRVPRRISPPVTASAVSGKQ